MPDPVNFVTQLGLRKALSNVSSMNLAAGDGNVALIQDDVMNHAGKYLAVSFDVLLAFRCQLGRKPPLKCVSPMLIWPHFNL